MSVLFSLNRPPDPGSISIANGEDIYEFLPKWEQRFFDETAERLEAGNVLINKDLDSILRSVATPIEHTDIKSQSILRSTRAANVLLSRAVELTIMSIGGRIITYHDQLIEPDELRIDEAITKVHPGRNPEWLQTVTDRWLAEAEREYEVGRQLRRPTSA